MLKQAPSRVVRNTVGRREDAAARLQEVPSPVSGAPAPTGAKGHESTWENADATGTILLTPNERRVAEDRRDCYWLYVVTNCATQPTLQEPVRDPARFPWHEVTKVAHYWLEVNAMTKPMRVREDLPPYPSSPGEVR